MLRGLLLSCLVVAGSVASAGCGGSANPKKAATPGDDLDAPPQFVPASANGRPAADGSDAGEGCLVGGADFAPQPATIEGVIREAASEGSGKGPSPFVVRLAHPRCVVGFPHAHFVSEVWIASTGLDLRPLVGARVRLTGDTLAGNTDSGEAALVLLVRDVERAASKPRDQP